MGVSLKYDVEAIETQKTNIETLINTLETARDNMKKGLEQIRKDWVSEGADSFFDQIDNDWELGVNSCIDVLDDLKTALQNTCDEYSEIESNASTYLTF